MSGLGFRSDTRATNGGLFSFIMYFQNSSSAINPLTAVPVFIESPPHRERFVRHSVLTSPKGRYSPPGVLVRAERMHRVREWKAWRSPTFSELCGERVYPQK